jgi:hypothetical protein
MIPWRCVCKQSLPIIEETRLSQKKIRIGKQRGSPTDGPGLRVQQFFVDFHIPRLQQCRLPHSSTSPFVDFKHSSTSTLSTSTLSTSTFIDFHIVDFHIVDFHIHRLPHCRPSYCRLSRKIHGYCMYAIILPKRHFADFYVT